MDSKKSNEYNFIFLMNKCILLYNYIDIYYQKDILNDIKSFINKSPSGDMTIKSKTTLNCVSARIKMTTI